MAKRPERNDLHGVLLFAKEVGPSSNQALQELRRQLGWVKAGHAGTLDPAASGLLLVLLGEAVKLVPYLADLEKEYVGVARFGSETDTQDAAGAVTRTAPWEHLNADLISAQMATFLGESLQEPPMYSALQVGGRRLYDIARAGERGGADLPPHRRQRNAPGGLAPPGRGVRRARRLGNLRAHSGARPGRAVRAARRIWRRSPGPRSARSGSRTR